jgi:DNA gyrase subunit A
MVVTVTHGGYIKRVPLSTYRAQRRGGKGRSGMATRDEDFVTRVFVANTHTPVLFFSSRGHGLQAQGLAPAARRAAGARQGADQPAAARARARRITTIMPLPEDEASWGDARRDVRDRAGGNVRRNSP